MPFIENDNLVKQIPAADANPPLGDTILPWASEAGSLGLDAKALHSFDHFAVELWAAIKDQVTWCRVVGLSLIHI